MLKLQSRERGTEWLLVFSEPGWPGAAWPWNIDAGFLFLIFKTGQDSFLVFSVLGLLSLVTVSSRSTHTCAGTSAPAS